MNLNDTLPKLSYNNNYLYLLFKSYGYVSGYTSTGGSDLILGKINLNGNVEWVKQTEYNYSRDEDYPDICINKNDTIYISYQSGGNVIISKVDSINGNIVWKQMKNINEYIGGNIIELPKIKVDKYDDVIIYYQKANINNIDIVGCKLNDLDGNIIWKKEYIENNNNIYANPNTNIDINGNIFISYVAINSANDIGLMKINNYNGSLLWKKYYKEQHIINTKNSPTIQSDTSGNIIISYETMKRDTNDNNIYIVFIKLDNNGKLIWARQKKTINTMFNTYNPLVEISNDIFFSYQTNGVIINDEIYNGTDLIFGKLDKNTGSLLWIKQEQIIDTTMDELSHSMIVDDDNKIYFAYQIYDKKNKYEIILSKYEQPINIVKESIHIKNLKLLLKKCPAKYNSMINIISKNIQTIQNIDKINKYSTSIHYIYLEI